METERLILRRFTMEDTGAMFANWASDAEVTKYLTWPKHENLKMSEAFAEFCVNGYAEDRFYQWAIVHREIRQAIGSISVVKIADEVDGMELGWAIGRKWWGNGYTAEAAKAVTAYLFREVGAKRIAARYDTRNVNSGRVMQKLGMKYEGTLRQSDRNNQGIVDCGYYSILRAEFCEKSI